MFLGFVVGLVVGANVGLFMFSLLSSGKRRHKN